MAKFSLVVNSVRVGEVVVTAEYPQDEHNYWVALIKNDGSYEVYKVLQEFTGWDAPQPIVFTDVGDFAVLDAGDYVLQLRERRPAAHSFNWKTWDSLNVKVI